MAKRYSSDEALAIARKNEYRYWAGRDKPTSAAARFTTGERINIGHKPKFTLDRSEPVFTIGSCFAREVENVLGVMSIPYTLQGHGIRRDQYAGWNEETGGSDLARGAFNKYCVHSMTHEIGRVLLNEQYVDEGLLELREGLWFDPHASNLKMLPKEEALRNRAAISAGTATIKNAKVVFMTLGMTESWIDTETGLAMNQSPDPTFFRRYPNRFDFVNYSATDIREELRNLLLLIREKCNPNMHFVLTVSPVPLGTTFQARDIIIENTRAKSTLRVVADEMREEFDFVDYFPSYEIVMNSPRPLAWLDDQLHVSFETVRHVMQIFKDAYYPTPVAATSAA